MSSFKSWQSGTASLMALAVTTSAIASMVTTTPASAQLFPQQIPQQTQARIPTGTSIPVRYNEAEKIVVTPKETMPLTLTVATNIINRRGTVLIPAGSQVVGQLEPVTGGSQFVARELVTDQGGRQDIDATSRVISQTEEIRRGSSTSSIIKGALIGGAAATALAGLTGNRKIGALEVLGGAGAGAAGGLLLGRKKVDVVVINPDTDLDLTLRSSLAVPY